MRDLLRSRLMELLASVNAFPTGLTGRADLLSLIKKLSPMQCSDSKLIRLGPTGDGGYLIPDDLEGISACFSPGVSYISGFEKDCAERGIKVFMADKSVNRPADDHPLFHFTKKFIGATSNDEFMTLDDWVANSQIDNDGDLLLQIDIEGYEYEVFLAASDALMRRQRIIVAEFHQLDQLWNRPFFNLASRTFEKILQTHACVHIHPNNCCGSLKRSGIEIARVMEFTFLRRDRIKSISFQREFPNPLDGDNTDNPPLVLPRDWYAE